MRLEKLIRHIEKSGCVKVGERERYDVYINSHNGANLVVIPKVYEDIREGLAARLCLELGIIPLPRTRE